jgi:hypothetical protein
VTVDQQTTPVAEQGGNFLRCRIKSRVLRQALDIAAIDARVGRRLLGRLGAKNLPAVLI